MRLLRRLLLWGTRAGGGGTPAFDYYIDSVAGSDSNDGTSEAAPWATLGKVTTASAWVDGVKVGLKRGGRWQEQINLQGSSIQNALIGAYGDEEDMMPEIDGTDPAGTWTYSGSGEVWYQDWTHSATVSTSYIWVYEDGVALTWDSSTAVSAQGRFNTTNTTASGQRVYVRATGGGDPNSNGKAYRITKRSFGIIFGNATSGNTIRGIWARRVGHKDGALQVVANGTIDQCISEWGTIHNFLIGRGSTLKNSISYKAHDCNTTRGLGSQNAVVAFDPTSSGTVAAAAIQNVYVYQDVGDLFFTHTSGATFSAITGDGFYGRSSGAKVGAFTALEDFFLEDAAATPSPYMLDGCHSAVRGIIKNCRGISQNRDGLTLTDVAVLTHPSTTPTSGYIRGSTHSITRLTIWRSSASFSNLFDNSTSGISITESIIQNLANIIGYTGSPSYTAQNNVYYRSSAANLFWTYANTLRTNLAAWVAAAPSGQDSNSAQGDPSLADPANLDFTPGSLATSSGRDAGADVSVLPDVPDWTTLRASWDAGQLGITPV